MKRLLLELVLALLFSVNAHAQENYALLFDGDGDYVAVPDNDDWHFWNSDFTIEFWVKFTDTSLGGGFCGQFNNWNFWEVKYSGNTLHLYIYGEYGGPTQTNYRCDFNPSPDIWYHLALARNGSTALMFIDGVPQIVDEIVPFGNIGNIEADLTIGSSYINHSDYVRGYMDELRIWNYAMPEQEIQAWMHQQATGTEPGLIACWNFNEGSGQVAHCLVDSTHDGQLQGDTQWVISDAPIEPPTPNQPPVAVAGPDDEAFAGDTITLDGSGSYDPDEPDGYIVSYEWISLSDPDNPVIAEGVNPEIMAHGYAEELIQLKVTDNRRGVGTDTMKITNPGTEGPPGPPGVTPEELTAMQNQITTLQDQNAILQQRVDVNRYLLEQLPQLKKKIEELEAQTEAQQQ